MSAFTTCAAPPALMPDPGKRVNYTQGLVLGVDELLQEFTYLSRRDEALVRDVVGYGTVAGLRIEEALSRDGNPALVVGSGAALSRHGRPIRVAMAQTVDLNAWLESQQAAFLPFLRPGSDSPPSEVLRLAVVLGYRECATDNVP